MFSVQYDGQAIEFEDMDDALNYAASVWVESNEGMHIRVVNSEDGYSCVEYNPVEEV